MEFSGDNKAIILNYLKDGQRDLALQYISRVWHINQYDSQRLLESFERQFANELVITQPPKKFDADACSGCLSKILKAISLLLIILSAGIFVFGYYFIDLFGSEWNTSRVPVVVTGTVPYYPGTPYVRLIIQYEVDGQVKIDTGSAGHDSTEFHLGDSTYANASDLGLGLDAETLKRMQERQSGFYYVGAGVVTIALIFLAVSMIFKVRPPATANRNDSRYIK